MYLKKIEAQGFKSFANKAVLEFTPGIMGIVGPNGSGKSNVADAVRWVLGEQSAKQLRGGSMQVVIFSGTEARKPMGYAYVSLTVDMADHVLPVDYDEVTVTRQVFRSGESEYRMNGNVCRLRDIYELFYDSGIGKEGYSIIGQGQIDQVLSNKPEERRLMFDEAAGITKFKKRRDITNKKLDSERQSLQRVTDILGELEHRVGPLEKQSIKARTYLRLKEELKQYEVGAYSLEAEELEKKLAKTDDDLTIVSGDLDQSHADADSLKEHYDSLTKENEELDKSLQEARGKLADLRVLKENQEGRIALLEEQIRTAAASKGLTEDRIAAIDKQIEELDAEKEEIYVRKNELDMLLDSSDDRISEAEEAAEEVEEEIRALEFDLEQKNRFIIETMNEKVNISGELQGLNSKEEQMKLRAEAIADTLKTNQKQRREREAQNQALQASLTDMRAELDRLKAEEKVHADAYQKAADEAEKERENYHRLSREASVLSSRRDTLENLAERYEGYNGSVRRVIPAKDVGVAGNKFCADAGKHFSARQRAALLGKFGVENRLHKHVSYLLGKAFVVLAVDGVHHLVNFLYGVDTNGFMRLRPVPRATVFRPQKFYYAAQIVEIISVFAKKFPRRKHKPRGIIVNGKPVRLVEKDLFGFITVKRNAGAFVAVFFHKAEFHFSRERFAVYIVNAKRSAA